MAVASPDGPPPTIRTGCRRWGTASKRSFILDEFIGSLVAHYEPEPRPERNHVQVIVSRCADNSSVPPHFVCAIFCRHVVGALRRPPGVTAICEIGLPGKRHLFGEEACGMGGIDPEFPPQIWFGVIRGQAGDVVGALDPREERLADARFERGFA